MHEQERADKVAREQELEQRIRQLEGMWMREHKAAESSRRQLRRRAPLQELSREPEEEEGWLTVYLDMLTLMLVLLVVMLAYSGEGTRQRAQELIEQLTPEPLATATAEPESTEPPASDPLSEIDTSHLGDDIEVIVNESTVSFRISSEIIFPPADAELSLEGLKVLQQLVSVLQSTEHRITVVGHTDAVPINTRRFPSNWELSGARAGSVVRYLEANGIRSTRLSAIGYADTRPLAENGSAAGRAKNRRVELILEKPAR